MNYISVISIILLFNMYSIAQSNIKVDSTISRTNFEIKFESNCFYNFCFKRIDTLYDFNLEGDIVPKKIIITVNKTTLENIYKYSCILNSSDTIHSGYFKNGQPDGVFVFNYTMSAVRTYYTKGRKEGIEEVKIGNLTRYNSYKDDLLDGFSYEIDTTGGIIESELYQKGIREGPHIRLYPYTYEIKYIREYKKDKLVDGDYLVYHINGKVFIRGKVEDGVLHGRFDVYDIDGENYAFFIYKNGRLVKALSEVVQKRK